MTRLFGLRHKRPVEIVFGIVKNDIIVIACHISYWFENVTLSQGIRTF